MRTLAVCGSDIARLNSDNPTIGELTIEDVPVAVGIMVAPDPDFDPSSPDHRTSALVETQAFSCNYRDKAIVLRAAKHIPPDRVYSIGSEFVGRVVAIGDDVETLRRGDRVIADGAWPGPDGVVGGLPTNNAGRELHVFDQRKLLAIPEALPDVVAAAFTIGAQTSYSMVRKLELSSQSSVLVTAAKSNTAIFAIEALRQVGCAVYATSSSDEFADELAALGVRDLFVVDHELPTFADDVSLQRTAVALGGFDAVIDPFFDVHLGKVVGLMAMGGRYVTCGLADQYGELVEGDVPNARPTPVAEVMGVAMIQNISLIGNCLGNRDDLQRAVDDYAAGRLSVTIDSTFEGGDAAGFVDRTYNARDRFGKVVYRYG